MKIAKRIIHLKGVIPMAFLIREINPNSTKYIPKKTKATIDLLLKLKVIFLLQFLQSHSEKTTLKSICLTYSGIEYL